MTVLYIITRFLTFPGAVLRSFFEHIICRNHKIVVEDNRALRRDELCSHVEHELMPGAGTAFVIGFVPMLLQLLLAVFVSFIAVVNIVYLGSFSFPMSIIDIVCIYLGCSLLVNCFPSIEDALNMAEKIYRKETNIIAKIILAPGFAVMFVGAYLERYCLTFLSTAALLCVFLMV